jgi:hypothetical protein
MLLPGLSNALSAFDKGFFVVDEALQLRLVHIDSANADFSILNARVVAESVRCVSPSSDGLLLFASGPKGLIALEAGAVPPPLTPLRPFPYSTSSPSFPHPPFDSPLRASPSPPPSIPPLARRQLLPSTGSTSSTSQPLKCASCRTSPTSPTSSSSARATPSSSRYLKNIFLFV